MATGRSRKKAEPKEPEETNLPPDCCGVCKFSRNGEDSWECWVNKPQVVELDGVLGWSSRVAAIDSPLDPACGEFKPRLNA